MILHGSNLQTPLTCADPSCPCFCHSAANLRPTSTSAEDMHPNLTCAQVIRLEDEIDEAMVGAPCQRCGHGLYAPWIHHYCPRG